MYLYLLVSLRFIVDFEFVCDDSCSVALKVFQFNFQLNRFFVGQIEDRIQSQPELTVWRAESLFVFCPVSVKAVLRISIIATALDDSPTTPVIGVVAKHLFLLMTNLG